MTHFTSSILLKGFLLNVWCCSVLNEEQCKEKMEESVQMKEGLSQWGRNLEKEFEKNYQSISETLRFDVDGFVLNQVKPGCGRMENRLGILSDGSKICIRYRMNLEQIQGELYSYHLAKLLGISNVLEAKLILINDTDEFWRRIEIEEHSWLNMKVVTATKFVRNTAPVYLPDILLQSKFKIGLNSLPCGFDNHTSFEIKMFLLQWSDMVLFDFLIGNFDRVASNMFNLQWYSRSLMAPIENLIQMKNGFLLFIDNEGGFSHGYRLLERYDVYNIELIRNMCVFRQGTLERLEALHQLSTKALHERLWHSIMENHKDGRIFDYMTELSEHTLSVLKRRIGLVTQFLQGCRQV